MITFIGWNYAYKPIFGKKWGIKTFQDIQYLVVISVFMKLSLSLHRIEESILEIKNQEAFAFTCVRKRRKFSEDAMKTSGSHAIAWAALPAFYLQVSYDPLTKCGDSAHAFK